MKIRLVDHKPSNYPTTNIKPYPGCFSGIRDSKVKRGFYNRPRVRVVGMQYDGPAINALRRYLDKL